MKWITASALCCSACGQTDGTSDTGTTEAAPYGFQVGGDGLHPDCTVRTIDPIADTSATIDAIGMSADDSLAEVAGTFTGTATVVYDGSGGPFTLVVDAPDEVSWVAEEGAEACEGFLYAELGLSIDGGSIVAAPLEGYATVVRNATDDEIETVIEGRADDDVVEGTLQSQEFDRDNVEVVMLRLSATQLPDGYEGIDWFQGCRASPEHPCYGTDGEADLTFGVAR